MYTIFVNEKPFIITDDWDYLINDTTYLHHYNDDIETIRKISKDFLNDTKSKGLVLHASNSIKAFEIFCKDYDVIEAAGGVLENELHQILMIYRKGRWDLPKGKIEEGEDIRAGAIRELKEEMNLDITIKDELGVNEYTANDPDVKGGKKRKRVTYFLAESPFTDLKLGPSGGLDDAQWFPLSQVGSLNFYDDTLKIIIPAINILAQKGRA